MSLDADTVRRVASLARIRMEPAELARMEAETAALRREQLDQKHQIATLTRQMATLLDWLSTPLASGPKMSPPT